MTLVWTRPARRDLADLRAWIAADNPTAARTQAERLLAAAARLPALPRAGRPGRVPGTRELAVPATPYLIAYRETAAGIEILRVLHASRRWPSSL